jgi:ketosteroid isomerase-like protein
MQAGVDEPEACGPEAVGWSFFALLGAGRIAEAVELLDDDGVYWVSTADARHERPMTSMKEFYRRTFAEIPMTFTKHDALASGDRVALEIESYAELSRGTYNNRYCFIMTVRDGKIVRINEYVDTKHAADVLVPEIVDARRARGQSAGEAAS